MYRHTSLDLAIAAQEDADRRKERARLAHLNAPTPARAPSSLPTAADAVARAQRSNPFRKGEFFNLTLQSMVTRANPTLAAALRAEAEQER